MVRKKTNGSILRWLTPVAITSDGRKLGNKMAAGLLLWRCDVVMWCVMSARDIRDNSGQAVTLWAATIQCSLISSGYCNVPLRIQLHLIAVKHSSSLIISPCLDLSFPSYTHFTLWIQEALLYGYPPSTFLLETLDMSLDWDWYDTFTRMWAGDMTRLLLNTSFYRNAVEAIKFISEIS